MAEPNRAAASPPDPAELKRQAREALRTLAAAREHILREAELLTQQRGQLEADRRALAEAEVSLRKSRDEFTAQQQDLLSRHEMSVDTVRQTEAQLQARMTDIEQQSAHIEQVGQRNQQLEEDIARREADLAEREARLSEYESRLAAQAQALESRRVTDEAGSAQADEQRNQLEALSRQIDTERSSLQARTKDLETQRSKLAERERSVAAAAEALEQRERELAAREQAVVEMQEAEAQQEPVAAAPVAVGPMTTPKSAGADTAAQFRKLRRDAKRKAIGA